MDEAGFEPGQHLYEGYIYSPDSPNNVTAWDTWEELGAEAREGWRQAERTIPDPTPCEARLADMARALELQAARLDALVSGVNTIGGQFNEVMSFVAGFREQMGSMGPMGMLKGMMGGGK